VDQNLSPGQVAANKKIVAFFREWLAHHGVKTPRQHSVGDRQGGADPKALGNLSLHEIEKEIIATPANDVASVAIKSYLVLYTRLDCAWSNDLILRCPEVFEKDPDPDDPDEFYVMKDGILISLLRDIVRLVPELAELCAPIIHDDAILIDADLEIQERRTGSRTPDDDASILKMLARIAKAEAKTPRGEAIKTKYAVAVDLFAED
jgi:hypothetical protein